MALLQAIVNLLGRTVGKILSALLDWAVVALFGRVSGRRKLLLWGLMASAAAWPLLLAGVAAPKAAVFLLAFVPLSGSVAPAVMRAVWIVLALLVPLGVGVTLHAQAPGRQGDPAISNIPRGVPITAGVPGPVALLPLYPPAVSPG